MGAGRRCHKRQTTEGRPSQRLPYRRCDLFDATLVTGPEDSFASHLEKRRKFYSPLGNVKKAPNLTKRVQVMLACTCLSLPKNNDNRLLVLGMREGGKERGPQLSGGKNAFRTTT